MPPETPRWLLATRLQANRATIADVARAAGVNKGTVSRALRGAPGVGAETRARIVAAANELDYSASQLATALATGGSTTIGIVMPTIASWYFREIAAGANDVLRPAGFVVEMISLDIDSDDLRADADEFRTLFNQIGAARGRDALLLTGTLIDDDDPRRRGVTASAAGLPMQTVPGIAIDQQLGGRLIGEHLVQLGHRDVAVVDGRMAHTRDAPMWDQRTDGLRQALRSVGADVHPRHICYPGDCGPAEGEQAVAELLAMNPVPTAVFCHSDELAFGLLSGLRRAGISSPRDVSVAAFDGHPHSRYWGLTTVDQHAYEQGDRAARALLATLLDTGESTQRPEIAVTLEVRETTGAPRAIR